MGKGRDRRRRVNPRPGTGAMDNPSGASAVNMVDIGVIAVLLISALLAYARGLVHEVLALAAWIGAIFATLYGFPFLQPYARKLTTIDIVADLFEDYGYWVAFFGPLLENTLFIGAIIPGTVVMLFSGIAAENGLISFFPAVLLSIAGAIIGDTISYGMGRFGWQRFGPIPDPLVGMAPR